MHLSWEVGGHLCSPQFPFSAPPGPGTSVVILLLIPKGVAKFLPIIKVVNVCECHGGGGLGRGLCTWLSRSLVWGEGVHVPFFLCGPWVHVSATCTQSGCHTEDSKSSCFFLLPLPHAHKNTSTLSPMPWSHPSLPHPRRPFLTRLDVAARA